MIFETQFSNSTKYGSVFINFIKSQFNPFLSYNFICTKLFLLASVMRFKEITFVVLFKFLYVENRLIEVDYVTVVPKKDEPITQIGQNEENLSETVIGLKTYDQDEYELEMDRKRVSDGVTKPCAIVVLSNVQHPSMQSLLRKYRYDANGILIPSSVKYFIKMTQGVRSSPHLVPLNDNAFSPLGGFVRYYKEVPPIPQSW